ncbi:MAG: T9SS type A sorting domain-containing protein [candidate division KSB1 bacterium]|nr:T9SS type A sorting domain-containing protein [candidate division KSB1 bacterium]MDZ7300599.1 T9SS type A sorting domain-containing protein [candidate division KSB1 bacterium]MDZ7309736.1 T9SS type A sorting domain-containing protein [candidate division KSB1 bacterium]
MVSDLTVGVGNRKPGLKSFITLRQASVQSQLAALGVTCAPVLKLEVFNLAGEHVVTLVNERRTAGKHSVAFNAANLASGFYLYKMSAGGFVKMRKLVIIK